MSRESGGEGDDKPDLHLLRLSHDLRMRDKTSPRSPQYYSALVKLASYAAESLTSSGG